MKKLIFLFLPILFIFSCKNAENQTTANKEETIVKPEPKKVTITGTIENPVDGKAAILGKAIEKVEVDVIDGKFEMDFMLAEPANLTFRHGPESSSLFLEPGDAVALTINPEQFDETIQLSGEGSEESNFLFKKYLLREGFGEMKNIFSLAPKTFAEKQNEIKNTISTYLEEYIKAHPKMNPDFVETETNSIQYSWATNKMNYPGYYEYFTKKDAPEMGDDYLSFMKDINMNDEKAFANNRSYNMLVQSFLSYGVDDLETSADKLKLQFDNVKAHITNTSMKNSLMFGMLKNELHYGNTDGLEKFVEQYNNETTDSKNKEIIASSYTKAKHLVKGVPAPTFAYGNTEDKIVDLKDLKGKNVYIDVWATWCGPCKAEIPSLKELEHQYANNPNIAFMSVSIDKVKDKEKWLKMIDDKKLSGHQLLADKDWKSGICEDYMIQGIPRFILIDKNGNIIDKNAPRPSSDEIKEILADLSKPIQTSMK